MTVRVSKPAFNLREKLSELDVPVGSHGGQIMQSSSVEETFNLVRAGRRNMVINGAMEVNQRYGTSSTTIPNGTGGTYALDRWAVNEATGGSVSVNMDGDPQNYPEVSMFSKAMQIACASDNSSLSANENLHFFQNIEGYNMAHLGWGTRAAKPVTLSFWSKSNVPGYYCVGLENSATSRCCIKQFYHNGSSKWQKFVLTYPGCGDGTWVTNNGIGIRLRFCLASGTTYDDGVEGQWVGTDELCIGSNQTNFITSTSNRFFITGVQLEEGTVATPFEHRPYPEEYLLCARYFWRLTASDANGNLTTGPRWLYFLYNTTSYSRVTVTYPTPLRALPSVVNIDLSETGNQSGVQFNGTHSTTVYVNNPGTISSLSNVWINAEL